MKTIQIWIYVACISLLALSSCKRKTVRNDSHIISKEIPVDVYDEIKVEGAIDIVYTAKPDEAAYLRIEAADDIMPQIDVKTKGKTLVAKAKETLKPSRFVIYTNSPTLKYVESKGTSNIQLGGVVTGDEFKIEMKGTGDLFIDNLKYNKAEFYLQGAGAMELAGQVHKCKIEITGTGDVSASDLSTNEMEANIRGNGNIDLKALDKLSIEIKGRGNVTYKGNPRITKQNIKGAGTVEVMK